MRTFTIPAVSKKPTGYIIDRIKTFEDACRELNVPESCITVSGYLEHHHESFFAYGQLMIIAQALNEGWTPDWTNPKEFKYYPWFDLSSGSGVRFDGYVGRRSDSTVGSRLCFKSRELAEYAGRQFSDIYEKFLIIKK